jgi:hypothetical protein
VDGRIYQWRKIHLSSLPNECFLHHLTFFIHAPGAATCHYRDPSADRSGVGHRCRAPSTSRYAWRTTSNCTSVQHRIVHKYRRSRHPHTLVMKGQFITMTEVSGVVLGVAGFKLPLSLEPHNQREEVCNKRSPCKNARHQSIKELTD